ncbi:tyrosine-type recombinase/integrase [Candidatus Accumulibacter phosphatis]|uniref:tyrosine-type recombinase/integrase n=1 Tax=Candidatus Accumulibacter phosphatis TaxID=327160 RepID=UPI003013CE9A
MLKQRHISPHSLRHSAAMMVLQATGDIRKVSLWLGHADIQTTEIYLRADPTEKLDAMSAVVPLSLKKRTVPGARQTDRLAAGRLNMLSDGSRHGRQHKAPTPAILHIPGLCISPNM